MGWRKLLILLLISINALESNSQVVDLTFHHLTEESGLTAGEEFHMFTDHKGLVWIGTGNGLLQFNGKSVKKYQHLKGTENSISENQITSKCFEDREGNLWFSSEKHINCYNRKTDNFISFSAENNISDYQMFALDNNDKIWLQIGTGNQGSLFLFDIKSKSFQQKISLTGEKCTPIADKENNITQLISTSLPNKSGLIWTDIASGEEKEIEFLYTSIGNKRKFPSPTKKVHIDSDSIAWVGIYDGIGKYKLGDNSAIIEREREDVLPSDFGWISDIEEYDDNRLLAGSDIGLLIFDKTLNKFTQILNTESDMPYAIDVKQITNLYIDPLDNLWVASGFRQEIAFSNLNKCKFSKLDETIGHMITSMSEDADGNIWCSTQEAGILVFDPDRKLLLEGDDFINNNQNGITQLPAIDNFIQHENHWWANVKNTFLLWNDLKDKFQFENSFFLGISDISNTDINYQYQLSSGVNLVAIGSEIFELKLSPSAVTLEEWNNISYLNLGKINFIYEDSKSQIYVADDQGRLVIFSNENGKLYKLSDIKDAGKISAILEDKVNNCIWIGSTNGLSILANDLSAIQFLEKEKDNFPSESIHNITHDKEGQLWLTSTNGLLRYHPRTKAYHRFSLADGLLSPIYSKNSMITSDKGEIWIGSKNGVTVFDPSSINLLDSKPQVKLSKFLVNDEPYHTIPRNSDGEKLNFGYEDNTFSFEFVALDYSDPESNSFTFQMVGYDETPVENGNRNFIRYGNLPEGDYTFKVWATNSDDVKNEVPFELDFGITPPIYRTWWFYLLSALFLSSIVYGIFKYRLEQALKVERLRVKISSDLHDDVGGILSGLAMKTEILELTGNHNMKTDLQKISEMSRNAMSRMRDTVWAIDSRKDKIKNLIDRMVEHAEETLTPKNIQFYIDTSNLNLESVLPTDIRQNIYLIYKEAITNTAKHSNGNEVKVDLKNSEGKFYLSIKDNGSTAQKNYNTTGQGTGNMHMRAKQLNAKLEVVTDNGYEILLVRDGVLR